ncbi:MAG: hypothetical protein KF893_23185 [Caldilineaceae bacterium]|nr:hypothetical protein [Caldilineaceae bacterium]
MMNHLDDEQLYQAAFADKTFADEAQHHLAGCKVCQQRVANIRRLVAEMAIAAHSQPTARQLAHYRQLASYIHRQPSPWSRLITQIHQMTLTLDNRQRLSLQGWRSGSVKGYRLLYSADSADVELVVEAEGERRRIEGEILPLQPATLNIPVLVEFHASGGQSDQPEIVVESTLQGRFQFNGIPLGYYSLMITPIEGPYLQIEDINIT